MITGIGQIRCETFHVLMTIVLLLASSMCRAESGLPTERDPLPENDADCVEPFPDADKLPPLAKWELGLAMQTGGAVRGLLGTKGREAFYREYEEGGTDKALQGIRERASIYALDCGPADIHYRQGVCFDFNAMCTAHGGVSCDTCIRAWAAASCEDFLKSGIDEGLGAVKDMAGGDEEWQVIVELAGNMDDPELLEHLQQARSQMVEDPIHTNCRQLF